MNRGGVGSLRLTPHSFASKGKTGLAVGIGLWVVVELMLDEVELTVPSSWA